MFSKIHILAAIAFVAVGVQAGQLRDRADDFIDDHNEVVRSRNEVAADRQTMAQNIEDNDKLKDAVKEFFNDRADVEKFAKEKAESRDELFEVTVVTLPALVKPTKATGNLQTDTQSFVNAYQKWLDKDAETQAGVAAIAQALTQPDDVALNTAAAAYFTARRERRSAKLQWQSDLKSMKKLVKFKNTFKPVKFDSDTLKGYTQEYLNDRTQWENLGTQVNTDFNNLKAAVLVPESLPSAVLTYLNDKAMRKAKAQEMQKDRQGMQRNNAIKGLKSFLKGLFAGSNEGKAAVDEEEGEVDQSIDHFGV